jgi:hypothetical protein
MVQEENSIMKNSTTNYDIKFVDPLTGLSGNEITEAVKAEVERRAAIADQNKRQALVEYKSAPRDTQESFKESFKEIPKEIPKECTKSATIPKQESLQRVHGDVVPQSLERMIEVVFEGIQGGKSQGMLWNLRSTAKGMKLFRLRFELARILKQAKSEKADEGPIWDLATDLGVPYGDILETADKVKRLPNVNAFDEAASLSRDLVNEAMHLEPPLRRLATMAWHLQKIVGNEAIYLPQRKVAEVFKMDQSVIQRQIKLLIRFGWIEEVSRNQKGSKTYVFYRCMAAIAPEG